LERWVVAPPSKTHSVGDEGAHICADADIEGGVDDVRKSHVGGDVAGVGKSRVEGGMAGAGRSRGRAV
jgi:hypothetical protein